MRNSPRTRRKRPRSCGYSKTAPLKPNERVSLGYAAGAIAENAGDYDDAFAHFAEAKRFSGSRFDPASQKEVFATLKRVFSEEFLEERKSWGDKSPRPVFIVGMPRSGTTLTEQILARHPEMAAGGELGDLGAIASSLGFRAVDAGAFAKRLPKLTMKETKELARRYLAVLDRVSLPAARVTDKMPHNFQHLGLVALLFPNARIIHCRREPLDTCVSCYTTQLRAHIHGYASDLSTLGGYYREYAGLMQHWRRVLPLPVYELDYERLIEDPETESRRIVEFVGLSWDPACLAPQESGLPVNTQSRTQVRQPIYGSSVGRWRRYEKHLGPLKAALGDLAVDA